jgi:hypothetical protein
MTTSEPTPLAPDEPPRWEVVASWPDYSRRGREGRFASLEDAEQFAENLRTQGYRDVQVQPIFPDDPP